MKQENARLIVALVLGIVVGAAATWGLHALRGTQAQIVEGYTTNVNQAGTAIGLASEPDRTGKGYNIAGAFWREAGGPWNTSGPTCLNPGTSGQRVRMGAVEVRPKMDAPGREVVVWLVCLD